MTAPRDVTACFGSLSLCVLMSIVVAPFAATPTLAAIEDGRFVVNGRLCLTRVPDTTNNGGRVDVRECDRAPQQRWRFDRSTGQIRDHGGLCLDAQAQEPPADGGRVRVRECSGSPQQTWSYSRSTGALSNAAGLCLDLDAAEPIRDGSKVEGSACNNGPKQRWRFTRILRPKAPAKRPPVVTRPPTAMPQPPSAMPPGIGLGPPFSVPPMASRPPPAMLQPPAAMPPAAMPPVAHDPPPAMPAFPWPPPRASATQIIPLEFFVGDEGQMPTLGFAAERIEAALGTAGYYERSYFHAPEGFALATRLERINGDGTPKAGSERWLIEMTPVSVFSPYEYLRALFTARPGYYRIIVFVVSTPFSQSPETISREAAEMWLVEGANKLPRAIAAREFTEDHLCTALIYEFVKPSDVDLPRQLTPSRHQGREHLQKAHLWQALSP